MRTCGVEGCHNKYRCRGLCNKHYYQMRVATEFRPCSVEGCDGKLHLRGLCVKHYVRMKRHGAQENPPRQQLHGENHPLWRGDDVRNPAIHRRIVKERGRAREHACVDCGEPAWHWSYNHTDPNEKTDDQGPYGLTPEHYSPRCVSCHKKFDLDWKKSKCLSLDDTSMIW